MNKEGGLLLGKALKIVTSFILIFSLTIPMYARAEYPKTGDYFLSWFFNILGV